MTREKEEEAFTTGPEKMTWSGKMDKTGREWGKEKKNGKKDKFFTTNKIVRKRN